MSFESRRSETQFCPYRQWTVTICPDVRACQFAFAASLRISISTACSLQPIKSSIASVKMADAVWTYCFPCGRRVKPKQSFRIATGCHLANDRGVVRRPIIKHFNWLGESLAQRRQRPDHRSGAYLRTSITQQDGSPALFCRVGRSGIEAAIVTNPPAFGGDFVKSVT